MDPKEIEDFKESVKKLTESLNTLNGATEESDKNFKDVFGKKFPNAGLAAIRGIEGLGDAASSAAAAMYRGERGMKVMANAFDGLADTIQAIAGIATFLTPWGRALKLSQQLLINGGAALIKGFSSFQKLTAEQSDKLFDTYQSLSKIGAVGAGGLEALNDSLMRAGFTVAELGQFAAVIQKNAKDLTYFGASAQSGAQNLAEISGAITKSNLGYSLQMLGYSAADIADATANNMVLQQRLGRIQNKTVAELAVEGAKFALELDRMARLTGLSREEQEQKRRALIEDERYAGFLGGEAREMGYNIQAFESMLTTLPEDMARGLQHLVAGRGTATTEEARRVQQTDPEAYNRAMAVLTNQASAVQGMQGFAAATGRYRQTFSPLTQFTGAGPGIRLGGEKGGLMFESRVEGMTAAAARAEKTLDKYIDDEVEAAKLNKGALKDQVDLRRQQMDVAQTLDTTVHNFRELNKVTGSLTGQFNKLLQQGPTPAGGRTTTGGAPQVGMMGATGVGGAALSGKSLEGLDKDFATRFSAAADEYFKTTGNRVNVTSGFRSYEEQMQLWMNRDKNPYPVAPPGRSLHETGRSVDVDRATADAMDRMGILSKYGLSRPVANDPVHIQGAFGFSGRISGPMSGYRVNALAHGDEEFSIRPMGVGTSSASAGASESTIRDLVDRVDELILVSKNQLRVNEKILRVQ